MQYMVVLILSAFLTSCVSIGIPAEYMPQKNPRPKYFLTVQGHIAKSLIKTVKVTWVLDYQTTNPKCQTEINDFEGIWVNQEKKLKYVIRSDKSGKFIKKIPLDYYFPGECHWELEYMKFEINQFKDGFITFFGQSNSNYQGYAYAKFSCSGKTCHAVTGEGFKSSSGSIPISNHIQYGFFVTKN